MTSYNKETREVRKYLKIYLELLPGVPEETAKLKYLEEQAKFPPEEEVSEEVMEEVKAKGVAETWSLLVRQDKKKSVVKLVGSKSFHIRMDLAKGLGLYLHLPKHVGRMSPTLTTQHVCNGY
jgi:hypothetical protein